MPHHYENPEIVPPSEDERSIAEWEGRNKPRTSAKIGFVLLIIASTICFAAFVLMLIFGIFRYGFLKGSFITLFVFLQTALIIGAISFAVGLIVMLAKLLFNKKAKAEGGRR